VGRLGGIFRAVHKAFDQPVSLKVFPSSLSNDPEKLARIGRELRVYAQLDHPNIVRSFEIGHLGDITYVALEQLNGETLAARIERNGRLHCVTACRIARDVASGLQNLHENEIIHRDVRPENIWIDVNGIPKLMEFGAARDALAYVDVDEGQPALTTSGTVFGEYDYMAPEQASDTRQADERSDIYSLGCVLYECLTGRPPFEEKNPVRLVLKHATEDPDAPSGMFDDIPKQVDETLSGMLAKQPDDRFQTAKEVVFALDQYVPKDAEPEQVEVIEVSPAYLEWARSQIPEEPVRMADDAVGVSPELTEFLSWMTVRDARRKKGST
jgi:serine/threonine protein kinase